MPKEILGFPGRFFYPIDCAYQPLCMPATDSGIHRFSPLSPSILRISLLQTPLTQIPMSTPRTREVDFNKEFMREATRLAIESVENGWGGPFGAVIVKHGKIIGRGQNRVLLTGIPVYHAEMTAIIDACSLLNEKELLGPGHNKGNLKLIPRSEGSMDPAPERSQMLKGCEIYASGAPCPMCMSAIYWARIDRLYFGTTLADASKAGFDDEFQYIDFQLPWDQRRSIKCFPEFEREDALRAFEAWRKKPDRHPY